MSSPFILEQPLSHSPCHHTIYIFYIALLFVLSKNSFIEIDSTFPKMHLVKVHNVMDFSIFTELCDHHNNLILEVSACTISSGVVPILPHVTLQPLQTPHLLSVSKDVRALGSLKYAGPRNI